MVNVVTGEKSRGRTLGAEWAGTRYRVRAAIFKYNISPPVRNAGMIGYIWVGETEWLMS